MSEGNCHAVEALLCDDAFQPAGSKQHGGSIPRCRTEEARPRRPWQYRSREAGTTGAQLERSTQPCAPMDGVEHSREG
jgi:hypothetical protein